MSLPSKYPVQFEISNNNKSTSIEYLIECSCKELKKIAQKYLSDTNDEILIIKDNDGIEYESDDDDELKDAFEAINGDYSDDDDNDNDDSNNKQYLPLQITLIIKHKNKYNEKKKQQQQKKEEEEEEEKKIEYNESDDVCTTNPVKLTQIA